MKTPLIPLLTVLMTHLSSTSYLFLEEIKTDERTYSLRAKLAYSMQQMQVVDDGEACKNTVLVKTSKGEVIMRVIIIITRWLIAN